MLPIGEEGRDQFLKGRNFLFIFFQFVNLQNLLAINCIELTQNIIIRDPVWDDKYCFLSVEEV